MVKRWILLAVMLFCPICVQSASLRVFLDVKPPPDSFYLGQEVSFVVKLFDRIGLTDIGVVPADWDNIDLFLDSDTSDQTVVQSDASYNIKTFRFSLVAKTIGNISFPPICLSAFAPTMISDRDLPENIKFSDSGRLEICTRPFSLNVLPLPNHVPKLFVANDVKLFQGIVPKTNSIKAGTPVKRSLVLTAIGTLPAYLPDFPTRESQEVRLYEGKTERTFSAGKKKLVSAVRQTIVYIPQKSGKLELPAISVFWLNGQTNQIEESTIPAYTLDVLPAEVNKEEADHTTEITGQTAEKTKKTKDFPVKKVLLSVFAVILSLSATYPLLRKKLKRRNLVKKVEQACDRDDPQKMVEALLLWAKAVFPQHRIINLSDVKKIFLDHSQEFVQVIDDLEMFLYGTGRFAKHLPSQKENIGKKVLQSFYRVHQARLKNKRKNKKNLPDLYPDG